jgi:hypothetical protein
LLGSTRIDFLGLLPEIYLFFLNAYLDKGAKITNDINFPVAIDATQQRSRREGPLSYTPTALQEGFLLFSFFAGTARRISTMPTTGPCKRKSG